MKDAMVTSCDHMTTVPSGYRCYTYCKDDWRKERGSEYMVCMGGKWRGTWPQEWIHPFLDESLTLMLSGFLNLLKNVYDNFRRNQIYIMIIIINLIVI